MNENRCIFCDIVACLAPASIRYETHRAIAFDPLDSVVAGHTVIIPKEHSEGLLDISPQAVAAVFDLARKFAPVLMAETGATGINLLHASGKDAQQSVFHFHIHLIPRHCDDRLDMWIKQGL